MDQNWCKHKNTFGQ